MDPGSLKIFTSSDVPRLRYIAAVLFGDIMGIEWEVITDKRKLGKNPVINYSSEEVKGSFRIHPGQLLFESGVTSQEITVSEWRGLPVFFQSPPGCDLPFDIFAASFYLITRYEEHLPFEPDEFGRFSAHSSLSWKNGFLMKPVVDLWVKEWTRLLVVKFQNMVFRKNFFRSLVTIDLDQPFEYLGKDVFRNLGGLIKEIGKQSGKAGERYRIVTRGEKDPWDVFDYIIATIDESGNDARFFIPTGERSRFDRQPSWNNEEYCKLIKKIAGRFSAGLHPSFQASEDQDRLKTEKERLEKILSIKIILSRFHYLKLKFPVSYANLLSAGITEDYSMGYADEPGFRAGIARPYFYYNLLADKTTKLHIFPFQIMDATLYQYKNLTPEGAGEVVSGLIDETRNVGGLFMTIWHNTSLLETGEWHGWRGLFESMLKLQQQ
ncbi:MAG: polysaccharide deacetylase family protein [Bacteroidales bacterium]|jgi:hypothetical protein